MKLPSTRAIVFLLAVGATANVAFADVSYFQDQGNVIRAPKAVSALGSDLFGDKVNLYTGNLEFIHTDVTIPGNNSLPVMVGRRLIAGGEVFSNKQFGTWELEIPHLHGTYTTAKGWVIPFSSTIPAGSRCSNFATPPSVAGAGAGQPSNFTPDEYWHGHQMYIPGQGDQLLLRRDFTAGPIDGQSYPVVTQGLWSLRCVASLANDTTSGKTMGEGFIAVSPDGTQYRFDWMATRTAQTLYKPGNSSLLTTTTESGKSLTATTESDMSGPISEPAPVPDAFPSALLPRSEVWIMPTVVTDRFGNTVTYTYDIAKPWQLKSIQSSDNRIITFVYLAGTDQIGSVSDGTRTWQYSYVSGILDTVTLPDASTWHLAAAHSLQQAIEINSSCDTNDILSPGNPPVATLLHPSGAAGTFTLTATTHGRSWVPRVCKGSLLSGTSYAYRPRYFSTQSLTHKTIAGPGLQNMDWSYSYGAPNASWSPCDGCPETSTTTVTDPNGNVSVYTFGNRYKLTEGQLQNVDTTDAGQGLVRSTTTYYRAANAGPYALVIGSSGQARGDGGMSEVFMPKDQQVITQQGTNFTWQATEFDAFARPTTVVRSNTMGMGRTETTTYNDNTSKWEIGRAHV